MRLKHGGSLKKIENECFCGKDSQGTVTVFETEVHSQQDTSRLDSWVYAKLMYPDGLIEGREQVMQSKLHAP